MLNVQKQDEVNRKYMTIVSTALSEAEENPDPS